MITITVPSKEVFDESRSEFRTIKGATITMEHSLKSLYRWEAKWHKPFLSKDAKTPEEVVDYLRCMTLTQNVDPEIYNYIPQEEFNRIAAYIENPMTATTIRRDKHAPKSRAITTAEVLYYDMIALQIPFECEKWHLNQLLMLIEVCSENNKPKKKMGMKELANRNRSLNAARRKALGTKG